MPAAPVGELPTETLPTVENLPNPVILPDMEFSKQNFNAAMEAEKSQPTEPTQTETPPPSKPTEPEPVPEKGTTDDKIEEPKVESPATRANLPEELLTGKKSEPKVDDAIAEIDAMVLPKNAKPDQVVSFSKLKAEAKRIIEERTARINELEGKTNGTASKHEIEAAQERIKAAEASSLATSMAVEIAVTEARQKVVEEFKVCCFFVLFCTVLTDFSSYFIASIDEGGFSCI